MSVNDTSNFEKPSRAMVAANNDEELRSALQQFHGNGTVCVQYSSKFCTHCHQMLPHFMEYSKRYRSLGYVLAQIDNMEQEAKSIKYTPTYSFYNQKGKKIDEFYGVDAQKLEDHLWLHSNT